MNTVSDPGRPIYSTGPGIGLRPHADKSGTEDFTEKEKRHTIRISECQNLADFYTLGYVLILLNFLTLTLLTI